MTPRCSLAATEVTLWARGRQRPATEVLLEDTAQVLSATPTLRGSASRGLSRMPGRSPGRPATLSLGRSVSQLPARSVSLWRSGCLVRCATMSRSSTTTMELELLVELQLSVEPVLSVEQELALLLVPELEQDMDMLIRHWLYPFLLFRNKCLQK